MLFQDIRELKALLEIDQEDESEDLKLTFINDWVTNWMEELLGRSIHREERTEYYAGTGTQQLLLKSRPVFRTADDGAYPLKVWIDDDGYFGSASGAFTDSLAAQVYGEDFALKIDQSDGTSRSGILIRINDFWPKPNVRQTGFLSPFIGPAFGNIKVQYWGGYTIDTLPGTLRMAAAFICAKLRYVLPLALELGSESYEERSISIANAQKGILLATVGPMLSPFRNWKW